MKEVGFVGEALTKAERALKAAEIGLSGEIRPIIKADQRIKEAEKLGFEGIVLSKYNKISGLQEAIEMQSFSKVESLVNFLF